MSFLSGLKARMQRARSGEGMLGAIVGIAVGLILFATVGFVGLQILATASTTSFQPVVVTIAITVVSILAALAVALYFVRHIKL